MMTCVHHLDKAAHHLLTGREVGNHTVAKGTDGADIVMCLFIHHLGHLSYGNHLVRTAVECHHRWFIYHDLVITDYNRVGRAKVHGQFLSKTKKSHSENLRLRNVSLLICWL